MKETPWGLWDPLPLPELVEVLRGLHCEWWIAGGFALEAYAGRSWREHDDIDAAVFRRDQAELRTALDGWDVHAADPPGHLRPWPVGEELPSSVHDIWARGSTTGAWRFQFMLDESDGAEWVFRRDARIRMRMDELTWEREGVRFIQPQVQILYKARGRRPKDDTDFEVVLPLLDEKRRTWLAEALSLSDPENPWLARILG